MVAAELLYASYPTPLLYASNRNLALDPANIGDGDTTTILSTTPALKPVGYVKTGLAQIRAMATTTSTPSRPVWWVAVSKCTST